MTLKGNLEVLNLSDIFQSLSLNQHTGTLRVTDGKREKLIYFAQGEITLLSSDKKLKIGDMLVAAGKVSQEDLEYALSQQKRTKKKLGEILVEEGFVTEDDVAEIVRSQIEEEIYDLFLWKKADFEFLIDYCPDKLKNPAHQVTKLQFNTNSLIMEALRRLDEWELISKEIPTLKEVYKVVNSSPAALEDVDLPDRVKAEVKLLDGERTVEAIAEDTTLSEFELCKLLFELKTRKIIAPLSPQELSDRAEECLSKGKFRQASALYERLAEVLPKNLSIRWHLAESLKGFGDEVKALEQYEIISKRLEGTRDRAELQRCYQALLELAPDRRDIVEKLRAIESLKWKSRALRAVVYSAVATVCAGLLVIGGVKSDRLSTWMEQLKGLVTPGGTPAMGDRDEHAAQDLDKQAKDFLTKNQIREAFEVRKKIITNYPKTGPAALAEMPIKIDTIPTGKEVWINEVYRDRSPCKLTFLPERNDFTKTPLRVEVRDKGRVLWDNNHQDLDPTVFHDLKIDLFQRPIWSIQTAGAVRSRPVFGGKGKDAAMYFTSWDGYLYGVRLEDRAPLLRVPLSDSVLGSAPFGEVTSDPLLAGDLLVFGTLDGKMVGYDVARRTKAFEVKVSSQPLLTRPAAIDDGQTAAIGGNDGDITLISLARRAVTGRADVLCSNRVTALVGDGATLIVGSRDNWVRWIAQGEKRRGVELRGDVVAAPALTDKVVVAGDRTGKIVCLDRARGTTLWEVEGGAAVSGIAVAGSLAIVSLANGSVQAYDIDSNGRGAWKVVTEKNPGRPAAAGGEVFVPTAPAPGGPQPAGQPVNGYIHALDAKTGQEHWTAQLPASVRGEIGVFEGHLFVGCEDGNMYCFETAAPK